MPSDPHPAATSVPVWIRLLGPLSLQVAGSEVSVPGARRRALLATLALARGRVVGVDRLVDTLWPDDPPDHAVQALSSHVSRIRAQLGPAGGRLTHRGNGYVLDLGDEELDVSLVRRVAEELPDLPPEVVLERAAEALERWRGPALEEFRAIPDLYVEAVALDEVRVRIRDGLLRALVDVGADRAVAETRSAVAADPLREAGVLLLMRALAREGRAAEAMAEGSAYRRRLADETGLDPGPELARLEQDIASGQVGARAGRRHRPSHGVIARPSGPLVGRQQDYDELLRLHAKHRVVTVTGPGGVGKTRLVLEAAAAMAMRDQVDAVVVDLATVQDATRVLQAVGSTLGLRVTAAAFLTAVDIALALADETLLLVLDNAEHVASVTRELIDAIDRHAPRVRVLVTSRMTLHARSEYVLRLQPLPLPQVLDELATLERQPSVRAFVEHARRHDRHYQLTSAGIEPLLEILQHLDGLPLAIELVARQTVVLPLAAIRDRLAKALDLLSNPDGDEGRQRTLRATIRWSYDRLTPAQQALLRAVSAFPGGVDLATTEELASELDSGEDPVQLLMGLVDSSLLDVDQTRSRYRLLFTVRSFLLDEAAALEELLATQERFLSWAVAAAEEIGAGLFSAGEALADRRLRIELNNLRAARDLARTRGRFDILVTITLALDRGAIWRDLREIWSWCLEMPEEDASTEHPRAVEILGAAAEAARQAGDYDRAVELAQHGLGLAGNAGHDTPASARCWSALAGVALYRGAFAAASAHWERSAPLAGPAAAGFLASAALAAAYGGERARAATLLEQTAGLGHLSPGNHAFLRYVYGELAADDDPTTAVHHLLAAVEEATTVGATFVAGVASVALASIRARTGDPRTAAAAYRDLLDHWRTTGHGPQLWTTARNAAALLLAEGYSREAMLLLMRADASPAAAAVDADIARHSGRSFLAWTEMVGEDVAQELRAEATQLTASDIIEIGRAALEDIATRCRRWNDTEDHATKR